MTAQKPKAKKAVSPWAHKARDYGDWLAVRLFGAPVRWDKLKDAAKNNDELGVRYFKLGQMKDAIFRLKIATWLEPNNARAWYYLGRAYLAEGKRKQAAAALKKSITMKPSEEAAYMLAIVAGGKTALPKTMPQSLVLEHFEAAAKDFTQEQVETYGYRGHALLSDAIRPFLAPGRADYQVLELGIGSGLMGPKLRPVAAHITGVDMSAAMIAQAESTKAYDTLATRELHDYLQGAAAGSVDIVAAAGVVSYIGELKPLFEYAAKALKPGGLFAFTADKLDGSGFKLDPQAGRFRFSKPYLQELAAACGFTELKFEEAPVYPDYAMWLCVFKK